jgi:hypothetical protein
LISGPVSASIVQGELTTVLVGSNGGYSSGFLSGTLTGTYNTGTGEFTFDPGTVNILFDLNPLPGNDLYTWSITDWLIGGGSTTASAYECIEGGFGAKVAAHLCANVQDNTDFSIETTTDYSSIPGTRMLGPNDVVAGPQQQLSDLAATTAYIDFDGTIVMETPDWTLNGGAAGVEFSFSVVPVPAAFWLFGSALGLLGWMRRKTLW